LTVTRCATVNQVPSVASVGATSRPKLYGITVDCRDPQRLARFWGALLDRPVSIPLPGWTRVDDVRHEDTHISFQPVPEAKTGKARLHLDVRVDAIETVIATVEELGGRFTGERHRYEEGVVVVMADPEGNEFCLVQLYE
jgi:predicted enzyme related to lactoylglutathione lyase